MPLNLGGGSFTPHIRWMSDNKQWVLVNGEDKQICNWTECIFDFAEIKTGWYYWAGLGIPPECIWDASILEASAAPSDGRPWERGCSVNFFSPQQFGGDGLREFSSSSVGARGGVKAAYNGYEQQVAMNPGMVPVIQNGGGRELRSKQGKNYSEPILTISRWVPRPPALDAALAEVAQTATQTTTTVVPVAPVTGQLSQPAAPQPAPGPAAIPVAPPPAVVADPLAPTATAAPAAPAPSTTSEF